jgi:hypothetical protein
VSGLFILPASKRLALGWSKSTPQTRLFTARIHEREIVVFGALDQIAVFAG